MCDWQEGARGRVIPGDTGSPQQPEGKCTVCLYSIYESVFLFILVTDLLEINVL